MSTLQQHVADYLHLRQALGHKMAHAARYLPNFVAYLEQQGLTTVSTAAAVAWAQATPHQPAPGAQQQRLSITCGFARFMAGIDPGTEIPPDDVLVHHPERRTPFIYSHADICALMEAARRCYARTFYGITLATFIGLLAITDMRVGEALRLTDHDVDWERGALRIRDTKFGKSREVVLDRTVVQALRDYVGQRNQLVVARQTEHVFVTEHGKPLQYPRVGAAFRKLLREAGVGTDGDLRPHLHDLRHAFAVRTLVAWYYQGADVEAWLPRLSTYLGHTDPENTYHYLTAMPELL